MWEGRGEPGRARRAALQLCHCDSAIPLRAWEYCGHVSWNCPVVRCEGGLLASDNPWHWINANQGVGDASSASRRCIVVQKFAVGARNR